MIQIAVLGYGTVGSGVVEVINRNQESINKKAGSICRRSVRRPAQENCLRLTSGRSASSPWRRSGKAPITSMIPIFMNI